MPELVRLYIKNVLIGLCLSLVFVAMLLWFNVANLAHLVTATQGGIIALVMLVVFNGIVFGGVQFAIAVMRMAEPEDDDDRGRRDAIPAAEPALVPVPVGTRPRRR